MPQRSPAQPRMRWRKLSDEVAGQMRDMILTGELEPGSRTTQAELAARLGVSTMPVREALLRLSAEGFVEASPNTSFTIVRTTPQDIADVHFMHARLAGELAARACQSADDAMVERMRDLARACEEAAASGDPEKTGAANWAFHREINLAAGAPKLLLMLRITLRFTPTAFYALAPGSASRSARGHQDIVAAFTRHDPEAARAAAEKHVTQAGQVLAEYFSSDGTWTSPDEI